LSKGEIPCLTKIQDENASGNKPTAVSELRDAGFNGRTRCRVTVGRPHLRTREAVQAGGSLLLPLLPGFWGQQFCRTHNPDNDGFVLFFPGGSFALIFPRYFFISVQKI
jgi:hypothetical protein